MRKPSGCRCPIDCRHSRGLAVRRAAPAPEDPKIEGLLSRIDRSSEKGDLDTVQDLRAKLADYAAGTGRYELAARQYELLLATRPAPKGARAAFHSARDRCAWRFKDYSRAIASFDDALHDGPKDWDANLARARAFSAIDMNQRAIESYLRCIRLRPTEAAPYEELAGVYERQGFLGKALAIISRRWRVSPSRRFICTWRIVTCI